MPDWQQIADAGFAVPAGGDPASLAWRLRTLRMLYLLADRGVRPAPGEAARSLSHRDEVLARLANSLAMVSWFAG